MTLLRICLGFGAVALVALIVLAATSASFGDSFSAIAADPWGLVSLVDLSLGFLVAGVFIALFETRPAAAVRIALLLLVLGNVVAAIWLVWRTSTIVQRMNLQR